MRQWAEVLTPGFGGPNGPAFPSHSQLSHTLGPQSVLKGCSLDCCCSLRVDVACPGATAVISVVRILAHRTWLTAAQKVDKTGTYSLQWFVLLVAGGKQRQCHMERGHRGRVCVSVCMLIPVINCNASRFQIIVLIMITIFYQQRLHKLPQPLLGILNYVSENKNQTSYG